MGYFVGEGIQGREKVRQKFANLQFAYFKTNERRRRTGEGKVDDSPYYKEMDEILGDQHKTQSVLLMDSIKPRAVQAKENEVGHSSPNTESEISCSSSQPDGQPHNPFNTIKNTVTPPTPRNTALQEMVEIQKENQKIRKEEFKAMIEMFTKQNADRHEETMALIKSMCPNPSKKQKITE